MNKVVGVLWFVLVGFSSLQADDQRPNILFAFADDWGKYAGCYARTAGPDSLQALVKNSTIDSIANHGTIFNHAFVTAPSCTPCRSSLLSGHFYRTGRGYSSGSRVNFGDSDFSTPVAAFGVSYRSAI